MSIRPPLHIDPRNGTVTLPDGSSVGPDLTQDAFRASPAFATARSQSHGTPPWIHYHFAGGQVEGHDLLVGLCFYDQMLVDMSLTVDLYPPGPKDWSNYSLEVEAATKRLHDHLLAAMFGRPSKGGSFWLGRLPEGEAALGRPLLWRFLWGTVSSSHDIKGGGTSITVGYGNRQAQADRVYRSRRPG